MRRPDPRGLTAYRIDGPRYQPYWAHRWHVDRWFRSWQAEWHDCMHACRAWTKAGAKRRARRWYYAGTDWKLHRRLHLPLDTETQLEAEDAARSVQGTC